MKKIILSSLVLILSSCSATPPAAKSAEEMTEGRAPTQSMMRKAKSCLCTRMYMPVCGEDNKTYGNSCEADCAGVKYTGGACGGIATEDE